MFQSIALQDRNKESWEPENVVFHGRYRLAGGKAHTLGLQRTFPLIPWQQFQLKYFRFWPEFCGIHTVKGLGWVFFL